MAERGKTKGILESFEVIVGHVVRRPFRRFMRGRFDLLKKQDNNLWLAVAWIYKKQPNRAGEFENLLVLALTGGEFFVDWVAAKTGTVGQILARASQEIMEDTPAVFRDYFSELPDDIFPVGYDGPKPEDFGAITAKVKEFLKESFNVFRGWIDGGFVNDFLEFNQGVVVAKATTRLGPDAMIEFTGWWDSLPKFQQDDYRPALKAVNDSGEMGFFLLLDPDQRLRFLRSVVSMGGFHLPITRRQRRQLRRLYLHVMEENLKPQFVEATKWLREQNKAIKPDYKDEPNWREREFSPAALKKNPFMVKLLPEDDPRRIAYEQRQSRFRRWRNVLLVVAALIVWTILNGSAQVIWATITTNLWWIFSIAAVVIGAVAISIYWQSRRSYHG